MTHIRQQVRNAVAAKIQEIPELQNSVFQSRVYELSRGELPAAIIFTENEEVEETTRQRQIQIQRRLIFVSVYIFARASDNIEDELDRLAGEVEKKSLADGTLGGIAAETSLENTGLFIGGDTDAPTGAAKLTFKVMTLTKAGEPDKALNQ